DVGRIGRLGDEIVGARLAGAALRGLVLAAGDDDHGKFTDPLVLGATNQAQQAVAVELGHVEIGEHHDDRAVFLDRLPGGVAVDGLQDDEARSQDAVERGADELRVVHDEYTLLRGVRRVPHELPFALPSAPLVRWQRWNYPPVPPGSGRPEVLNLVKVRAL